MRSGCVKGSWRTISTSPPVQHRIFIETNYALEKWGAGIGRKQVFLSTILQTFLQEFHELEIKNVSRPYGLILLSLKRNPTFKPLRWRLPSVF